MKNYLGESWDGAVFRSELELDAFRRRLDAIGAVAGEGFAPTDVLDRMYRSAETMLWSAFVRDLSLSGEAAAMPRVTALRSASTREELLRRLNLLLAIVSGRYKDGLDVDEAEDTTGVQLARVRACSFYEDQEFIGWLNNGGSGVATWHVAGQAPGEYSDVFFTWCHWEGSDSPTAEGGIPQHLWDELSVVLEYMGYKECLVWMSNTD